MLGGGSSAASVHSEKSEKILLDYTQQIGSSSDALFESPGGGRCNIPLICWKLQERWSKVSHAARELGQVFSVACFPLLTVVGQNVNPPPPQWKMSHHIPGFKYGNIGYRSVNQAQKSLKAWVLMACPVKLQRGLKSPKCHQ